MSESITGRVICGARAASCVCNKDPGHVSSGDPVHSCADRCTGEWQGDYLTATFSIITLPFAR